MTSAAVTKLDTNITAVQALGEIMKNNEPQKALAVLVIDMLGDATIVKRLSLANYIKLQEMIRVWTEVHGPNKRIDINFREAREIATWLNSL